VTGQRGPEASENMTMVADDIQTLESRHVLQTYRRQPVTFVRGSGVHLYDIEGREYIDLLSGIGVTALGHGHERLTRAITEQAQSLLHTSNLFYHPLQGQLAERLTTLSGLERAFFCNSGTEAVEASLKFARRYWHTLGESRTEIVALEESFHGRTIGALSVTSDAHYRTPFEPLLQGVKWISASKASNILEAVTTNTAAVILEPIQGEGGVRPLTPAFAAAVNEACARTGALLIADEVQSGCGRTGYPFYSAAIGLKPQMMALGKALGGGVPVGATLISAEVAAKIAPGDHGTTYGGNLLACRAAICVLDELVSGGLLAHVGRIGQHFEKRLQELAARHPEIKDVRGAGVMRGIELNMDAAAIVPAGLRHGVVVNRTAENVIRLLPPFVITESELDEGLGRLDLALRDITGKGSPA
jgi:acetylornithine/N-succinyldiaminopimelate aminotransferase